MKKKVINGLASLLIGLSSIGCQPSIDGDVRRLVKHCNEISKILELDNGEFYKIEDIQKKGEPLKIIIYGSDGKLKRILRYEDSLYGDRVYDKKTKTTIEGDLKIIPLPKKNYFPKLRDSPIFL